MLSRVNSGQSADGNGAAQRIVGQGETAGQRVYLKVIGAGTAHIGDSDVSTANGLPLVAGDGMVGPIEITDLSQMYFNAPAGTKIGWLSQSP